MKNNDEKLYYYKLNTIIGTIYIIKSCKGLRKIEIIEEDWSDFKDKYNLIENKEICEEEIKQLEEYFSGKRKSFDLALDIKSTDFRKKVWNELINIPYGEVRSYSDIARAIGKEKAVRAIGQANKANPIPIVIPCHRVTGKNQKLRGYAGNHTDIQEQLIKLERKS